MTILVYFICAQLKMRIRCYPAMDWGIVIIIAILAGAIIYQLLRDHPSD